jgi:hypothetical protein
MAWQSNCQIAGSRSMKYKHILPQVLELTAMVQHLRSELWEE